MKQDFIKVSHKVNLLLWYPVCSPVIKGCLLLCQPLDCAQSALKIGLLLNWTASCGNLLPETLPVCILWFKEDKCQGDLKQIFTWRKKWGLICKAHRATVSHFEGNLGWQHSDLKSNWSLSWKVWTAAASDFYYQVEPKSKIGAGLDQHLPHLNRYLNICSTPDSWLSKKQLLESQVIWISSALSNFWCNLILSTNQLTANDFGMSATSCPASLMKYSILKVSEEFAWIRFLIFKYFSCTWPSGHLHVSCL